MSTGDKVTQGVLVRMDILFLVDNGYPCLYYIFVAPLFDMWSIIRVQVVTSFEYCEEAGILCQC